MKISRLSQFTGKINVMDLDVTKAQLHEFIQQTSLRMIQEIFPQLSPAEREFLLNGVTPEEWDEFMGEEE